MSYSNNPTANPIHVLFAELGIVDPIAIADAQEQHAEVIAAYCNGKLTAAALKHSLARASENTNAVGIGTDLAEPRQTER